MEAKVAILARIPNGDGYRLETLPKKKGAWKKPEKALCFYLRYTDAKTGKRTVRPAGEDFNTAVATALNIQTSQDGLRNGQEPIPEAKPHARSERLTIADAVAQWIATFPGRLALYKGP